MLVDRFLLKSNVNLVKLIVHIYFLLLPMFFFFFFKKLHPNGKLIPVIYLKYSSLVSMLAKAHSKLYCQWIALSSDNCTTNSEISVLCLTVLPIPYCDISMISTKSRLDLCLRYFSSVFPLFHYLLALSTLITY